MCQFKWILLVCLANMHFEKHIIFLIKIYVLSILIMTFFLHLGAGLYMQRASWISSASLSVFGRAVRVYQYTNHL